MHKIIAALAVGAASWMGAAQAAEASPTLYALLGSPDGWTISGSFRARGEAIADQFRPAPAPTSDQLFSMRTTLFAGYGKGLVHLGAEMFDSRAYGERPNSTVGTSEVDAFELGQAYVSVGDASQAVTAGRFTMNDGSRRLIARNQFRNTINSFTGARFDWTSGNDQVRLFWTLPQQRLPDDVQGIRDNRVQWDRESTDLQFFGGSWTHRGVLGGSLELYGYGLLEKDSPELATRNRRLFTPGARLYRAPKAGRFDYELEGVYQTGRARRTSNASDLADLKVEAWFLHAEVGRTFEAPWRPRIALQYDQASGDRGDPGRYGRFDTLFGARRGEYGPTSLWGAVQRANLRSPAIRLEVTPDRRWDGFLAVRGLWLDSATDSFASTGVRDSRGLSGRYAGTQAEARLRYWLKPGSVRLETGGAALFKGRFLAEAPNAPRDGDSRYAYADVTFTF